MPTYEYRCEKCGELFEVRQKFADEPLTSHEKCGGRVDRLLSAPAFQFKGSGWYVNDYAKGGNSGSGSNKSDSSEKPAKKDSSDSGSSNSSSTSEKSSTSGEKKSA